MKYKLLNQIPLGNTVTILQINCNIATKRRLLDLGIISNALITPIFKSSFGDLTAYEINNNIIALRKEDTENIKVKF